MKTVDWKEAKEVAIWRMTFKKKKKWKKFKVSLKYELINRKQTLLSTNTN